MSDVSCQHCFCELVMSELVNVLGALWVLLGERHRGTGVYARKIVQSGPAPGMHESITSCSVYSMSTHMYR